MPAGTTTCSPFPARLLGTACAEALELLLRHIPDRYEHLVRYVGWYSNRVRAAYLGEAAASCISIDTRAARKAAPVKAPRNRKFPDCVRPPCRRRW